MEKRKIWTVVHMSFRILEFLKHICEQMKQHRKTCDNSQLNNIRCLATWKSQVNLYRMEKSEESQGNLPFLEKSQGNLKIPGKSLKI